VRQARDQPSLATRESQSMNLAAGPVNPETPVDSGLAALCGISAYYRIAANPSELRRRLSLGDEAADFSGIM
jgi:ATP-binding cassette, subfamily B, bacterial HlyB/CyaB